MASSDRSGVSNQSARNPAVLHFWYRTPHSPRLGSLQPNAHPDWWHAFYNTYSPRVDAQGRAQLAMSGPIPESEQALPWCFIRSSPRTNSLSATSRSLLASALKASGNRSETINNAKEQADDPLADQTAFNFVPLFGLGLRYAFTPEDQALRERLAGVSSADLHTEAIRRTPNTVGCPETRGENFVRSHVSGFAVIRLHG